MKKIFKNPMFTFILGAITFGGIVGVSAYTILANNIGYTPSDSSWKKSNGENITNVKDAIDELYAKSTTYKNLNAVTTVSSGNLLNGITAYDNLGNLITGNVNTDCIEGSFVCTTCNTSNGQLIADFVPKTFIARWFDGNNEIIHYYNRELNSNYWYEWTKYSNNYTASMGTIKIEDRYVSNSMFILHSFSDKWINHEIYYIACK